MSRRRYKGGYRAIRTTQERRMSFSCEAQYVRPARNFKNLPSTWDDTHVHGDTSWKGIRKKQYRAEGRGQKHEIVVTDCDRWYRVYKVKEYFEKYDIPYRIEDIKEQYTYNHRVTKWVERFRRPRYQMKYSWVTGADGKRVMTRVRGHQIGWETIGDHVYTGEVRTIKGSKTVGFKITWWSDKDIGISYILNRIQHGYVWDKIQ